MRTPLSTLLAFVLTLSLSLLLLPSPSLSSPLLRLPSDGACPVTCFVPDPVCGEDGTTYWCGAVDAACSGVDVAADGFCAVGNGGGGVVPGQAFLLVHIAWLIVLGFSFLFGFF